MDILDLIKFSRIKRAVALFTSFVRYSFSLMSDINVDKSMDKSQIKNDI